MAEFVFVGGILLPDGWRCVFNKDNELEDYSHTYVGIQKPGTDPINYYYDWNVRGWYLKDGELTLIGEDGEYVKLLGTAVVGEGNISCGKNIVTGARSLTVGQLTWGMRNTLCKETGHGVWNEYTQGLDPSMTGITSIAANDNATCYLVGWDGVIYKLEDGTWTEIDSPVNTHLNDCLVTESGSAYACGQDGTILSIQGDLVQIVDHDFDTEDFLGFREWKGKIFLFSHSAAYLFDGYEVEPSYSWDPEADGIYASTMLTQSGFWLLTEFKVHVFDNGDWR